MKPTIGRIVHYHCTPSETRQNNNNPIAAATVTSVFNDTMVNVKVHTDGETDWWRTNVHLGGEAGNWSSPWESEAPSGPTPVPAPTDKVTAGEPHTVDEPQTAQL